MGPVLTNPWRTLGLQATATRRELTKRVDDLKAWIEFGKSKNFPLDFSSLFPLIRTVETVDDAAQQLDNDERKLLHAFFWFINDDSVDELALECLENNSFEKASDIWRKQILKSDVPHFSWLINYSTILFLECHQCDDFEKRIHAALQILGSLVTHKLNDLAEKVFPSTVTHFDKNTISRKLTDILLEYIYSELKSRKKEPTVNFLTLFGAFPEDTKTYLLNRLTTPHIKILEEAVAHSQQLRKNENSTEIGACNALLEHEESVNELLKYSASYQVKSVLNEYANEALECSIYANNELDDTDLAMALLDKVLILPSWDATAARIAENEQLLTDIQADKRAQKQFAGVIEYSETPIKSLMHAKIVINVLEGELRKLNVERKTYLMVSSICVNNILEYLIEQFNSEFSSFEKTGMGDIVRLTNFTAVTEQIKTLTNMLYAFDVDEQTRTRLKTNLQTVSNVHQQLNEVNASIKIAREKQKNNTVRKVIGWGILIFILIAVFS